MSERCPVCSAVREDIESSVAQVCSQCGHVVGAVLKPKVAARTPFRSMVDSLVPKAELKNATRDLFSLNGESRPPVISFQGEALPGQPDGDDVADISLDSLAPMRDSQSSLMFSLAELKKSAPERPPQDSLPDRELWQMQAATPLFGTADDAALLAAPNLLPLSSGGAVSLPQRESSAAHKSLALWVGGAGLGLAVVSGTVWTFLGSPVGETDQTAAAGALAAQASPAQAGVVAVKPAVSAKAPPTPSPALAAAPPVQAEIKGRSGAVPVADDPTRIKAEPPVTREISQPPVAKARVNKPVPKRKRRKKKTVAKKVVKSSSGFSKSKAKRALVAAASKAAGCGKKGRAGGKGKIRLTFGTNGRVKSARIVSARFTGSSTGKCALRHFRAARIPAFDGKPVTVAKSFAVR